MFYCTECPHEIDLLPIIAGVVGGIVAVGLLLLIVWKILTSMMDGIEYARFIQESKNEKWAKVGVYANYIHSFEYLYEQQSLDTNKRKPW